MFLSIRMDQSIIVNVVGEYGTDNLNTTLQATINLHDIIHLPGDENIGRIAWTWDGNDTGDLNTDQFGGGLWIDSWTNPTNFPSLGQMIWGDNHCS